MLRQAAGLDVWNELEDHFKKKDLEDWIVEVERCLKSDNDLLNLGLSAKVLFDAHYGTRGAEHKNLVLGYGLLAASIFFNLGKIAQAFSIMTRLSQCEGSDPVRRYLGDLFASKGFVNEERPEKKREHQPSLYEAEKIYEDFEREHVLEQSTDLHFLTKRLGEDDVLRLIEAAKVRKIYEGERLFFKTDEPRYLYILVDGKVRLMETESKSLSLQEGSVFGELSLFVGQKTHSCEALVLEDGEVLELSVEALTELFVSLPQLEENFRSLLYWRLFENFSRDRVEFSGVEAEILEEFFYACKLETAHHEEVLRTSEERRFIIALSGRLQTREAGTQTSEWVAQKAPELIWLDQVDIRAVDHLLYMSIGDLLLGAEVDDFRFIQDHLRRDK